LQATQKKIRMLSVQPGLRGSNDLRVGRKMVTFQFFFIRVGLRTYQHPCIFLVFIMMHALSQVVFCRVEFSRAKSSPVYSNRAQPWVLSSRVESSRFE